MPIATATTVTTGHPLVNGRNWRTTITTVKHREFVTSLYVPAASGFSLMTSISVTPTNTQTPWVAGMATNFEFWKPRSVILHLVSALPTTTGGNILTAVDYDVGDVLPATQQEFMAYDGARTTSAFNSLSEAMKSGRMLGPANQGWRYTGEPDTDEDPRTYKAGTFLVAVDSVSAAAGTKMFDVYLEYVYDLRLPHLSAAASAFLSSRYMLTGVDLQADAGVGTLMADYSVALAETGLFNPLPYEVIKSGATVYAEDLTSAIPSTGTFSVGTSPGSGLFFFQDITGSVNTFYVVIAGEAQRTCANASVRLRMSNPAVSGGTYSFNPVATAPDARWGDSFPASSALSPKYRVYLDTIGPGFQCEFIVPLTQGKQYVFIVPLTSGDVTDPLRWTSRVDWCVEALPAGDVYATNFINSLPHASAPLLGDASAAAAAATDRSLDRVVALAARRGLVPRTTAPG
jgi:hypothetical protein